MMHWLLLLEGVWSKPIAVASGAEIVDIHQIKEPREGYTAIDLDPSLATIHHYRNNMTGCQIVKQSSWRNVRLNELHRYMDRAQLALPDLCQTKNQLAV
jgi:hypothetical protein